MACWLALCAVQPSGSEPSAKGTQASESATGGLSPEGIAGRSGAGVPAVGTAGAGVSVVVVPWSMRTLATSAPRAPVSSEVNRRIGLSPLAVNR